MTAALLALRDAIPGAGPACLVLVDSQLAVSRVLWAPPEPPRRVGFTLEDDPLLREIPFLETASGAGEHRVFTGKRGGCADDLAVALVMAVHLSTLPYEPAPTATGSPVRSKVAYCRSSGTARSPSGRGIR